MKNETEVSEGLAAVTAVTKLAQHAAFLEVEFEKMNRLYECIVNLVHDINHATPDRKTSAWVELNQLTDPTEVHPLKVEFGWVPDID